MRHRPVKGKEVENGIVFADEEGGIEEYRLSNGMKLLLVQQLAAPVVGLLVVYHVGSRNEAVGHTGATHLLEHMMFKGTPKFNTQRGTQIAAVLKRIGAQFNATTWYDRTNYFEVAPKDQLELVIEIEADRMRNSLIRDEDRESERFVVRNELERGENEPQQVLGIQCWATAFREHPYHHPTIGWRDDVENVPTERLREFYHTFYWPNNATTILVGDFQPERALKLMAKHFGSIDHSPHAIPHVYTQEPRQEGERRFRLRRAGEVGIVQLCFHIVEARHPDIYPLAMLARVLTGGVTTRLYQKLVDSGLALSVTASAPEFRDPSLFEISAILRPEVDHMRVEEVIEQELELVKSQGIHESELERTRKKAEADVYYDRDGALHYAFAVGESEACADWRWFLNYVSNIQRTELDDVKRVANQYLYRDNCTVGWFVPKGQSTRLESE